MVWMTFYLKIINKIIVRNKQFSHFQPIGFLCVIVFQNNPWTTQLRLTYCVTEILSVPCLALPFVDYFCFALFFLWTVTTVTHTVFFFCDFRSSEFHHRWNMLDHWCNRFVLFKRQHIFKHMHIFIPLKDCYKGHMIRLFKIFYSNSYILTIYRNSRLLNWYQLLTE